MTTLADILADTMLFQAAKMSGGRPVPFSGKFNCPKPVHLSDELDEDTVRANPIWKFKYDTAEPATFRGIKILSRGMGMKYSMFATAFDQIEFSNVKVERQDGTSVELPLTSEYLLQAWWLRVGKIDKNSWSLWQLEANLDPSVLAAFAFQLDCGVVRPMSQEEIDELGDSFMPQKSLPPPSLDWLVGDAPAAWVCIGPSRYLVVVELCLHKENNDFVPGEIIGFARIHPHAFVISNDDIIDSAQVTITMARPAHAMTHGDDTMMTEHKALVVTDTNEVHIPILPSGMPLPYTDNLYDYFEFEAYDRFKKRKPKATDHPMQETGEVTLADARFTGRRRLEGVIKRNTSITLLNQGDVNRTPRSGQFDNVHIAPRMRWRPFEDKLLQSERIEIADIPMLNMCLHDCTHMHIRWSEFLDGDGTKMTWGWAYGRPYAKAGAPSVPENQTVFASFPNQHTVKYRAVAHRPEAGGLQVFCHHGLAYAIDQWPGPMATGKALMLHNTLRTAAKLSDEMYTDGLNDLDPPSWQEFYWRIRWTVKHTLSGKVPHPRSEFDLEECMK
jgi:hypothetical protein